MDEKGRKLHHCLREQRVLGEGGKGRISLVDDLPGAQIPYVWGRKKGEVKDGYAKGKAQRSKTLLRVTKTHKQQRGEGQIESDAKEN